MTSYKLAILCDCTTQHLVKAIKGYGFEVNLAFDIYDADYNQILAQTIDENSELYTFQPQSVLIFMCVEKLYEAYCKTELSQRNTFADKQFAKINQYWSAINKYSKANTLQFTFANADDRVFGNFALKTENSDTIT